MLEFHLGARLHAGLAEAQLRRLIAQDEPMVGKPRAEAARASYLANVLDPRYK